MTHILFVATHKPFASISCTQEPRPTPPPKCCLNYSEDIAVVEREILPSYKGRVKYKGLSWLAQCEEDIAFQPEARVLVTGRRNITLIVKPLTYEGK